MHLSMSTFRRRAGNTHNSNIWDLPHPQNTDKAPYRDAKLKNSQVLKGQILLLLQEKKNTTHVEAQV